MERLENSISRGCEIADVTQVLAGTEFNAFRGVVDSGGVVRGFAWVMARLMGASGAESLNVAASLFLGQTEAPLTIRPYLPRLRVSGPVVRLASNFMNGIKSLPMSVAG